MASGLHAPLKAHSSDTSAVSHEWVRVAHSCPTLCNPLDYAVHGILQARILEWVAFPSPGDLPNPGIKPRSPSLQADSLPAEPPGKEVIWTLLMCDRASQVALVVETLPANAGAVRMPGLIPGWGRCPGGGRATHSSTLAWRIPRTEEPRGL